jgi:hypothetical protein
VITYDDSDEPVQACPVGVSIASAQNEYSHKLVLKTAENNNGDQQ